MKTYIGLLFRFSFFNYQAAESTYHISIKFNNWSLVELTNFPFP